MRIALYKSFGPVVFRLLAQRPQADIRELVAVFAGELHVVAALVLSAVDLELGRAGRLEKAAVIPGSCAARYLQRAAAPIHTDGYPHVSLLCLLGGIALYAERVPVPAASGFS